MKWRKFIDKVLSNEKGLDFYNRYYLIEFNTVFSEKKDVVKLDDIYGRTLIFESIDTKATYSLNEFSNKVKRIQEIEKSEAIARVI